MKKKGIFLLVVLFLLAGPVGVHAVAVAPPSPPPPPAAPSPNSMMAPAAQNALSSALELKEKAHSLLDQAAERGLDVSDIEGLIAEADALVEKAQKIVRANPIPASNMLREAAEMYEDSIPYLEDLLS